MLLILSNRFSATFLPFTRAALRSYPAASSFPPWAMRQRADSGIYLTNIVKTSLRGFRCLGLVDVDPK